MARSLVAQPFLTLDAYRRILNIPLYRFNGIDRPDEAVGGCDMCWSQWMRDQLALALYDAEMMLADALGFFIGPRYVTEPRRAFASPVKLRYGHITAIGTRKRTAIMPSSLDFDADPAEIIISDVSDPSSIRIVENETLLEIVPDSFTVAGNTVLVRISQAKLLRWSVTSVQSSCIDYDPSLPDDTYLKPGDLTVYVETTDDTLQASVTDDQTISAATVQIEDAICGIVSLHVSCSTSRNALINYINYLSGTTAIPGWENAIISLAHTFMSVEPCGCSLFDVRWQQDARIPPVLSVERLNCPFGQADGAWRAWKWVQQNRIGTAFIV